MRLPKRRRFSLDINGEAVTVAFSLPHRSRRHRRRLSSSSSSFDSRSDGDDSSDTCSTDSSDLSSGSSNGSSSGEEEKGGWRRRRRRRRRKEAEERQRLLLVGGALLVVLLLAVGVYAFMTHSSAPSSSAGSPTSTLSTSGSGSPYLSGSKTTSSSGPTASVKPSKDTAWFPVEKVRGVNLGSLFIFEPWMARTSWEKLGCSAYDSEWPCIEALGLDTLQPKFEEHWSSFYNETDFTEMARLGLNTVRIPLGYWTVDSLIQEGEYLPRNQMGYLKQVLGWAKSAGIYVILDLHGAPGSQTKDQSFTGHGVEEAGFFTDTNYQRAYDCLTNWTTMAHTDEYFSTDLTSVYYPGSQKAIRDAEVALNAWGSGDPTKSIDTTDRVAYDDHNYAQWIVAENSRTRYGYLSYLCTNTRSTDMAPVIVGEWSLSTIGGGELETNSTGAKEFFQQFAAAQIWAAEKGAGQVFWSWKTELGSSTWGYYDAVQAGYIPEDLSSLNSSVCDGYG
ncbi:hypothetical protein JCM10213_005327 [Rhodosporidiobolus nylandii]